MRHSFLLSKYTIGAMVPYFFLIWLLLSVILFVQQGTRYADVIFDASLPDILIWELMIALIPSVVAFTGPIALLVGVVIGLSRMQGDSELTAMRAAGVGAAQIVIPAMIIGILLSGFALFVNLKGVPFAAQIVRQVALKAALYKLKSPVDPGVFNTEIDSLTIFVREGDIESGKWRRIFILQEDKVKKSTRLITAKEGFIATKGDNSEIVLEDSRIITLDASDKNKFALDNAGRVRLQVQTRRGEIIERLAKSKENPEEMGLRELASYAYQETGINRTEALLLWQRRILLSITPLVFALLGTALVSKFNRGGRGLGIVLALVGLVTYYMLTLLVEQLARTGAISVFATGAIPLIVSGGAIVWLFYSRKVNVGEIALIRRIRELVAGSIPKSGVDTRVFSSKNLLDKDIIFSVLRNYLLTLAFLMAMYILFTAFELWKFAGTIDNGVRLLVSYIVFLIPFIYIQIAPTALMVASLGTYIIKTRQNEVVTWTAAGRSVYRLLLPCFLLSIVLGVFNFGVQELVLTRANRIQDQLREQIRSRNAVLNKKGKYWIASEKSILSFERIPASDNGNKVSNLSVYTFDQDGFSISSIVFAKNAILEQMEVHGLSEFEFYRVSAGEVKRSVEDIGRVKIGLDPFGRTVLKPSHLNISQTMERLKSTVSEKEKRIYTISLFRKYAEPFMPFIIILLTAPFALSIHRKGNVVTIAYAAGLWLCFVGTVSILGQFGQSGFLPAALAVWGPLVIFGLIGLILLSRVRT